MKTLKQTPFFPLPPSRPLPPSLPPVPDTSQTSKVPPFRSRRGRKNCYGAYKPESRQIPVRRAADRTLFFLAALLAPDSKRKPQVTGIGALSDPCGLQGEGGGGWIWSFRQGHSLSVWTLYVANKAHCSRHRAPRRTVRSPHRSPHIPGPRLPCSGHFLEPPGVPWGHRSAILPGPFVRCRDEWISGPGEGTSTRAWVSCG